MHYFYILKSKTDSKYYYGSSSDIAGRFKAHSAGYVESTKSRRPFELVYYEAYQSYEQALDRERTIKRSGTARDAITKRI